MSPFDPWGTLEKACGAGFPLPVGRELLAERLARADDNGHSGPFYQRTVLSTRGDSLYPLIDERP